jgi:hypothetical protein
VGVKEWEEEREVCWKYFVVLDVTCIFFLEKPTAKDFFKKNLFSSRIVKW